MNEFRRRLGPLAQSTERGIPDDSQDEGAGGRRNDDRARAGSVSSSVGRSHARRSLEEQGEGETPPRSE